MRRETSKVPPEPRLFVPGPRDLDPSLKKAYEQQHRRVEDPDQKHIDGMEESVGDKELERQQSGEREDVERGRVREDGVAFDALEDQHCPVESDFGTLVGQDSTKCVGQHGHQDGQEERISEKGKGHHENGTQDDVKVCRLSNSRAVKAKPDPKEPFGHRQPSRRLLLFELIRSCEPLQCQQETGKAPEGDKREQSKVFHDGVKGYEDDVVGHDVEGDSREKNRGRNAQDVKTVAVTKSAVSDIIQPPYNVDAKDEDEAGI